MYTIITNTGMKRIVYLATFTALGILVQFLIHAGVEIWYIGLLLRAFPRYSLGLSWAQWVMIHHFGSIILFFAGAGLGFWQGQYWWRRIYEEHILRRWFSWSKI